MSKTLETIYNYNGEREENIKSIQSQIIATRNLRPYVNGRYIANEHKEDKKLIYVKNGIQSILENDAEINKSLRIVANSWIQNRKAGETQTSITDRLLWGNLHNGLYTMITRFKPEDFIGFEPLYSQDGKISNIVLTATQETIYKACFGVCVDDNGRALGGSGDILHDYKKRLAPYLNMDAKHNEPTMYATLRNKAGNLIVLEGTPMTIKYHSKDNKNRNLYSINLDLDFAPINFQLNETTGQGSYTTADQYVLQLAGLPAFIRLGMQEYNRLGIGKDKADKGRRITMEQASKIITIATAGLQLQTIAGLSENTFNDHRTAVIRSNALEDICPESIRIQKHKDANGNEKEYTQINRETVEEKLNAISHIYNLAWEKLDLSNRLSVYEKQKIYHFVSKDISRFPSVKSNDKNGNLIEIDDPTALFLHLENSK